MVWCTAVGSYRVSSKVMVSGQFSQLFYITKPGVLQGYTLAAFLSIIVLDSLKLTELGRLDAVSDF